MANKQWRSPAATDLATAYHKLVEGHTKVWRAKREWESILDCLDEMVLLADRQGRVVRCNQAFACFLVRPFEEVNGRGWEELLREQGLVREISDNGLAEYSRPADGRVFCCRTFPFAAEYTEIRGTVVILQDVTERQRIARELQRKNSALQAVNEEIKASQAKLLQQEKLASIGQLAAGVAHEINNPVGFVTSNLSSMVKYLQRLREFVNEQQRRLVAAPDREELVRDSEELRQRLKVDFIFEDTASLLRESLEGVERVKTIVQNLKKFSRVDQARCSRVDINRCLEDTLNIIWNELKYTATVHRDLQELPLSWCYPQQLNQVFMNLLLNAGQALAGQGEIKIRSWSAGDDIMVAISDNGGGIPPENISRLFDPFFTTKEVGKGTGLGLSIVYDIVVKQHGGEVTADSEPGKGSTFTIRLPVYRAEKDLPPPAGQDARAKTP